MGESVTNVGFVLNDHPVVSQYPAYARLSEVLRREFGQRDVKVGCNAGDCGACTVLLDGASICACLTPVAQAEGCKVETASLLAQNDQIGQRLVKSFSRHGAVQCGICTPGMVTSAVALMRQYECPSIEQIESGLDGVLCRCTGYRRIIDAIVDARDNLGALDEDLKGYVGERLPRLDGTAKLEGSQRFGDDIATADVLEVRVIRSPHHCARFTIGDLEAFRAANPEIVLVLTAEDVPGQNRFGVIPDYEDQPVFAEQIVKFRGEAIAAIAGPHEVMADFDVATFPVTWTTSRPISGSENCINSAVHDHAPNNEMCRGKVKRGDLNQTVPDNRVCTVEGRFSTGFVEHAYIEPEAGLAEWDGQILTIHACTQAPVMDQEAMAKITGLEPGIIRIVPTAVGGGFGAKLDLSVQPVLGLASLRLGKPVRMAYSRTESMQSTTKRHASKLNVRLSADIDGRLQAMDFDGWFDTGAYASWGPTVAARVPVHASGPYFVPNYRAEAVGYYSNSAPAGAFRGFGVPQAAFALETLLDQLADKIGMDRLALRRLNALENGQSTVTGQVFEQGVGIGRCFDALASDWELALERADVFNAKAKMDDNPLRMGVGVAAGWYGCGNTSLPNPSTIKAGIDRAGRIVLHQGAVDIGQGSNTVIAQIFAQALGVDVQSVVVNVGDTLTTPDAGKTSASRQTFVSGNAALGCGALLRQQLLRLGNVSNNTEIRADKGAIELIDGDMQRRIDLESLPVVEGDYVFVAEHSYDPPTLPLDENGQGNPYAQYGYAAQIAVVSVDIKLGLVKALEFVAAHDVGKAINPVLVEGQIHGGIAQGLGMALMEEFIPGKTENLHDYLIPTIGDVPPIKSIIVEEADGHGPYGAKGLGEHALIPTAPAIVNAIRHACGADICSLPATPDKVLAAIQTMQRSCEQ